MWFGFCVFFYFGFYPFVGFFQSFFECGLGSPVQWFVGYCEVGVSAEA